MRIDQGCIFLADLNPVKGHEQAGFRPVLVFQNNILNTHLNTVLVVPITTNLKAKGHLTTFFLPKELSSMTKDSLALLFQLRCIDKKRLVKKIGEISGPALKSCKRQLSYLF
jgi:mRNA interferase MazF